jgi:hypothetical protein
MKTKRTDILRFVVKESSIFQPLLTLLHAPKMAEVVFFAAITILLCLWIYYPISQGHGGDFIAMLSGRDNDAGWWDGRGVGYGPVFAIYDYVLRGVNDLLAMRVMFFFNLIMLVVAFLVILRRFLPSPRTREEFVGAFFLWVCFYPTFQALRQNNVEITELFFLVLMFDALSRRSDGLAGVCLGIAGATKILPFVLLLYFFWRRRYRLVATSILTGIGLLSIVMVLHGETLTFVVIDWLSRASSPFPSEFQANQALSGLIWRAFSEFDLSTRWMIEHPIVMNASAARVTTNLTSILLLVFFAAIIFKRVGLCPPPIDDHKLESVEIAIVLIVMLVLIPHNHTHYFILVAWIYVAALREWLKPEGPKGFWVIGLFFLSYIFLGLLHIWRLFDPFLKGLGPVTGVDLARLASLPFFGALAALVSLIILHSDLQSQN